MGRSLGVVYPILFIYALICLYAMYVSADQDLDAYLVVVFRVRPLL